MLAAFRKQITLRDETPPGTDYNTICPRHRPFYPMDKPQYTGHQQHRSSGTTKYHDGYPVLTEFPRGTTKFDRALLDTLRPSKSWPKQQNFDAQQTTFDAYALIPQQQQTDFKRLNEGKLDWGLRTRRKRPEEDEYYFNHDDRNNVSVYTL